MTWSAFFADPRTLLWFWLASWSFACFALGLIAGWSYPRPSKADCGRP